MKIDNFTTTSRLTARLDILYAQQRKKEVNSMKQTKSRDRPPKNRCAISAGLPVSALMQRKEDG